MPLHENPFHHAVYLTGPTAAGKTAIAVELSRRLDAEILCLDSMTLYRGMDIGTAKPTFEERRGVPHHLLDVVDPCESASVALYRRWALDKLLEVESKGKKALFVGGTPLYLKALLRGLFEGPCADEMLRVELSNEARAKGIATLHARLAMLDPATATRLSPNDERRIVRALEVMTLTGEPLSKLQSQHDSPAPADVAVFALHRPRAILHDRINRRVDAMFEAGFVEEVRRLIEAPQSIGRVASQGVGYREVIAHLTGDSTLGETIERVKARTRQFAKRQETWFRGLVEVEPFPVDENEDAAQTADRLAERLQTD